MKPFEMMRRFSGRQPAWVTLLSWANQSINNTWGGYTMRVVISKSILSTASKVRLTLGAGSAGFTLTKCYAQLAAASGDAYDFASTPVQVKFSGAGTLTLAANDSRLSDEVALPISASSDLVISAHFSAGNVATNLSQTAMATYYNAGDSAATVNVSGYGVDSSPGSLVEKLEGLV